MEATCVQLENIRCERILCYWQVCCYNMTSMQDTQHSKPFCTKGWELEERSLLLTLVHSSPLHTWAFKLRASSFYPVFISLTPLTWCPDGSHVEQLRLDFGQNPKLPHGRCFGTLACHDNLYRSPLISPTLSMATYTCSDYWELQNCQHMSSLSFEWKFIRSMYQTPDRCKFELSTRALVWRGPQILPFKQLNPANSCL